MADQIDPAIQQAFRDFARQLDRFGASLGGASNVANSSLTGFGSSLRTVGQGMAKLRNEMDSGRRSFAETSRIYQQLKEDFESLDQAAQQSNAGQRIREAQAVMAHQLVRQNLGELAGEIAKIGIAGALTYYKNQMITAVQSLQDNVGGVQMAVNLQRQSIIDQTKTYEKVGDAVSIAGAGLALFNPIIGGILVSLGQGGKAIAKLMGDSQKDYLDIVEKEFRKTEAAYKDVTSAGVLFSLGMTEMRQEARRTQLDLADYGKLISENGSQLAKIGGTAGEGAKRFGLVSSELIKYRASLLNLGITEKEQNQAVIDYMAILKEVGKLQRTTPEKLAMETSEYLKNLKAISAITGEDVKKAQQRARDAALQGAVNNKLSMASGDAALKFQALIRLFPGLEKGIQQLYTIGSVVDPIQAQIMASIPALEQALRYNVDQIEKPGESLEQYTLNMEESLRQQGGDLRTQARALQKTTGMVNVANDSLAELSAIATRLAIFGEQVMTKGTEMTKGQITTLTDNADELTTSISNARVLFGEFSAALSGILDGPMTNFGKDAAEIIKRGAETILTSLKPYLEANRIILTVDKNIGTVITDAINSAVKSVLGNKSSNIEIERYAKGGIVGANGPNLKPIMAGEDGPEAIVPLDGNRSIPVSLKIDENIASKQFNDSFASILNQINEVKNTVANTRFSEQFASVLAQIKEVENSISAKQVNNNFAAAMAQIKEQERARDLKSQRPVTTNETQPNLNEILVETISNKLSRAMLDLKSQIASDNDKQLNALQLQIDKLDSLITTAKDNVTASENIAHALV